MLDVEHYLNIYKGRKRMMETGIINPLPKGKEVINEIVAKLSKMPLDEKIELIKINDKLTMVDSKSNIIVTMPKLEDE